MQIPKAQKGSQIKQLFVLLESAGVKAAHKHVDEIDPRKGEKEDVFPRNSWTCEAEHTNDLISSSRKKILFSTLSALKTKTKLKKKSTFDLNIFSLLPLNESGLKSTKCKLHEAHNRSV